MTSCREFVELLALADAEIAAPGDSAALQRHLATCAACRARRASLSAVQAAVARSTAHDRAPASLRASVLARLMAADPGNDASAATPAPAPPWRRLGWWAGAAGGWVTAAIMASVLVLPLAPRPATPAAEALAPLAFIDNHARALVTDHLIDIASSDRHSVKPWFRGRIDYAPPVADLSAQGFALAGGRLDYVDRRRLAVLVYQRRQHAIALYVWPQESPAAPSAPTLAAGAALGYHVVQAQAAGMRFAAVSDLDSAELLELARAYWRVLQGPV